MSKQATITLTHYQRWNTKVTPPAVADLYRVERITDSVLFSPRDELSRDIVADLCENGAWKVIIQTPK